ncbi:MAG: sensor histidine kinase [Spirochaetales bacterium]|nr:sensor histidine kinase [Spirochaetales bacterium]
MNIKKLTIKAKLILFCALLVLVVSSAFVYVNINSNSLIKVFINNQETYHAVNGLNMGLRESRTLIYDYLNSNDYVILQEFNSVHNQIKGRLEIIVSKAETNEEKHLARALVNSTKVYFQTCQKIIEIKGQQSANPYIILTTEGDKILNYIYGYTSQYLQATLNNDNQIYQQLSSAASIQRKITGFIILGILILSSVFVLIFSNFIANPIMDLVRISREMAEGDLHVRKVKVKYYNEVGLLTDSFNQMSESIRNLIHDLEEKGEVEARLYKEKLKTSRMEELLKEAQFQALQSQVNPHFLFNTLNVISRAIRFESKEIAVKLIQSLAQLFRYNLEQTEKYSDIKTEVEIVRRYLFIQEFRFSDRLTVKIEEDPHCNHILIPKLTLQPLVENALIHGLEHESRPGHIHLQIKKRKDHVLIRIFDNGIGITEDRLRSILNPHNNPHTGHTTSVGIKNVIERLEILCEGKFTLTSVPSRWTMAGIKIPYYV